MSHSIFLYLLIYGTYNLGSVVQNLVYISYVSYIKFYVCSVMLCLLCGALISRGVVECM